MAANIRLPLVAGRFYTADSDELRGEVQGYLDKAASYRTECADLPAIGCMVPHAGYMFSGLVAGLTLGQIPVPETVLLLGPSHTGRGAGLSLWPGGAWRTPLGDVPVDSQAVDRLVDLSAELSPGPQTFMKRDTAAHLEDHALEVVLPFLQVMQPNLSIIPLSVRVCSAEGLPIVGEVMARFVRERSAAGRPVLLLTSSDMSHYLPHDEGKLVDRMALEQVSKLSPDGLFNVCAQKRISMCGFIPMTAMLYACRALGAHRCCITAHTSSGITGRDFGAGMDKVVGYAGAIIN